MKMTSVAFGTALFLSSCTGAVQNTVPGSLGNARAIAPPGAGSYAVIHSFTGGNDGGNAETPITFDAQGNAYGATVQGGTYGYGTVFRLHPKAGGQWQETVLYSFTGFGDGKNPHGGVVLDSHGNLYGTTTAGGSSTCTGDGCGVIFEVPHGGGESVLYAFQGANDGFGPGSPLTFDGSGNLYGMTPDGGKFGYGTIFTLQAAGSSWHFRTLHAFTGGRDGTTGSLGGLLADAHGALYGVTEGGGTHSAGTVFKLAHDGSGWKFTTIYAFKGTPDGANPYGALIQSGGKLYGTTYDGGSGNAGTVFELTATGTDRVVYNFTGGKDGGLPTSTLIAGSNGVLYGTTSSGGSTCGCGTVFSIATGTSKETVLHSFGTGTDGQYPYFGLTQSGTSLYSSTVAGGASGNGTIFSLSP